jgi:hypothetical protein
VLDQILLGRDNAFARAVAQGNLESNAPVLKARQSAKAFGGIGELTV